jgi:hypothetical protein
VITTTKKKWKCLVCDGRTGTILATVYVGGDTVESAKAAAGIQAKLRGIKKRVRITARPWSLAEDPRAVAGGYVGRVEDV